MSDTTAIRTRFAPSPTGTLHIGGARTALFNWLIARHYNGKFLLRIEDTDLERSKPEFVDDIKRSLEWLGLNWDEEYKQSDRFDLYRQKAESLIEKGLAYRCVCTPEEIGEKREIAMRMKRPWRYDGTCREKNIPASCGKPYVVRLKSPLDGDTTIEDLVRGTVTVSAKELDDLVLMRGDSVATFQLANVVDDVDMRISHILRGEDHLTNTFRQVHIYNALGATLPRFGHVPLIHGKDGKLSKRDGAVSTLEYRDQGYLPEALLNFLVRIGWAKGDMEILSRDQMIEHFDFPGIGRSAGIFNVEKLVWLNGHYLRELPVDRITSLFAPAIEKAGFPVPDRKILVHLTAVSRERVKTLTEMVEMNVWAFARPQEYTDKAQKLLTAETRALLERIRDFLSGQSGFDAAALEAATKSWVESDGLKLKDVAMALRVALTGSNVSPPIFDVLNVLGKDESLARIGQTIARIA